MSLRIGIIIASTRPTRVGDKVAKWFLEQVKDTPDVDFELIDLKEVDLPFLNEPESASTGKYTQEKTIDWSKKIGGLDGFVMVTPEYNNGTSAALKNAIDTLYQEWDRKPVAFVGYGGYGATRAVEQLVDTMAKVGAAPLSKTFVGVIKSWEAIDDNGSVKPENVMGHPDGLMENLVWWAKALKTARV